jgi:hypothetical protein
MEIFLANKHLDDLDLFDIHFSEREQKILEFTMKKVA